MKLLKEISKNKYSGINSKTSKEVVILKISENYFNKKNCEIFSKKITEDEKIYFANIESFIDKGDKKIIIYEKGEGNFEENLAESFIYYTARHIQYIFNQINIAINFLYNNNIQFDKLQLSDIIYNIEDNKPIFKLAPFFLNGNQKGKKIKIINYK